MNSDKCRIFGRKKSSRKHPMNSKKNKLRKHGLSKFKSSVRVSSYQGCSSYLRDCIIGTGGRHLVRWHPLEVCTRRLRRSTKFAVNTSAYVRHVSASFRKRKRTAQLQLYNMLRPPLFLRCACGAGAPWPRAADLECPRGFSSTSPATWPATPSATYLVAPTHGEEPVLHNQFSSAIHGIFMIAVIIFLNTC